MLIIEILEYMWEHKGSLTFDAILLFFMRKWLTHEAHKILHLGREGEIQWILERLERMTGERYDGRQDFSKLVRTRYIKSYYSYLRKGIELANRQRRVKTMENIKWATLVPGVISAAKLVLQSFGIDIPDEHINAIVNGAAAVGAIVAIFMSHRKKEVVVNVNAQYQGDSGPAV